MSYWGHTKRRRPGEPVSEAAKTRFRLAMEAHNKKKEKVMETKDTITGVITGFKRSGQARVVETTNGSAATLFVDNIKGWRVGDSVKMDVMVDSRYEYPTLLSTSKLVKG